MAAADAEAADDVASGDALPRTGGSPWRVVWLAVLLAASGAAVLLLVRRLQLSRSG